MLSFEFDPGKDSLYVLMRFPSFENLEHWIKSLSPQQNNNSSAKKERDKAQSCSFGDEVGILKRILLIWRAWLNCFSGSWQRF